MESNQVEAITYMLVGLMAAETGQLWEISAEKNDLLILFHFQSGGFEADREYQPYTKGDIMIGNRGPYRPNLSEAMYSMRYIARQVSKEWQIERDCTCELNEPEDGLAVGAEASQRNGANA